MNPAKDGRLRFRAPTRSLPARPLGDGLAGGTTVDRNLPRGHGGAQIRMIIERRVLYLDARLPMAFEPSGEADRYWEGTCPNCRELVSLWDDLGVMRTTRHAAGCGFAGEALGLAKAWRLDLAH